MLPTRFDMGQMFGLFVNVVAVAVSKILGDRTIQARDSHVELRPPR